MMATNDRGRGSDNPVYLLRRRGIEAMAARLPDSDPRTAELRSRIVHLENDCGCTMGGVFFAAAVAVAVTYFLIEGRPGIISGLLSIPFVLVASAVGKLFGLGIARIRLLWLLGTLNMRLQRSR
jgi:hypothetical protein